MKWLVLLILSLALYGVSLALFPDATLFFNWVIFSFGLNIVVLMSRFLILALAISPGVWFLWRLRR